MPVSSILMGSLMAGASGGTGQGIANVAGGLLGGAVGYFQRRKAKKELSKLVQPQYNIPQEILKNQKMAEQAANEGMPSQQYNNAMKNIQRTQNNLLAGATDRRSALMALPKIQQQANDATGNLDAQDANMRLQNQRTLYNVGNTTAQYRDKAFNINEMQPYEQKRDYYNSLLGAGNQNLLGGIDKLTAGVGGLIGPGKRRSYTSPNTDNTGNPTYYNGYSAQSQYQI